MDPLEVTNPLPQATLGGTPTAPTPGTTQPMGGGFDVKQLLTMLPAILAGLKGNGHAAQAFMQGYQQAQQRRAQAAQQQTVTTQVQQRIDLDQQQLQQRQAEQQAVIAERQRQVLDAQEAQRQQHLMALSKDLATVTSKPAYDRSIAVYANLMKTTPADLVAQFPLIVPAKSKEAAAAVNAFLANPINKDTLGHPEMLAKQQVTYDKDGDGIPERVSLMEAAQHGGVDLATDPVTGQLPVYAKDATPVDKAGADAEFVDRLAIAKAEGKNVEDPKVRSAIRAQANQAHRDTTQKPDKASLTPSDIKPGSKEFRVAQDLAYGRLTAQQFRSLYAYSRDTNAKTAIYDKATELNPAFNLAAFEAGYKLASNPKVQQQLASLDNVLVRIPDMIKVSDAAARSAIPTVNRMINKGGYELGGVHYSNFRLAQIAFADELSGALGYGSATDMSREMGVQMTDPNLSPANFAAAMRDVIQPFIASKRDTLLKQMNVYGQPGSNPAAPPAAKPGYLSTDPNWGAK